MYSREREEGGQWNGNGYGNGNGNGKEWVKRLDKFFKVSSLNLHTSSRLLRGKHKNVSTRPRVYSPHYQDSLLKAKGTATGEHGPTVPLFP